MQIRMTEGDLLNEQGDLEQAGYATALVRNYDRHAVRAGKLRVKEWDYYLIYNHRFGVALTVDDNSYMGLMSISFLDFIHKTEKTVSPMNLFPMGRTGLPSSSESGITHYQDKKCYFDFQAEAGKRILRAWMKDFDQGLPIRMKIVLTEEPEDSMVIATPFDKPGHFYYNQKIIGMRASGAVEYQGRRYVFHKEDSFGLLDWGRGVWTYKNTWYWSAMQGLADGKTLGFNLGYGFGDTKAASENMVFYEGKAHKLEEVRFWIPQEEQGNPDFMKPWKFTSGDQRLELDFTPILDRCSFTSVGVILSDQHQVFGWFDGFIILDGGEKIPVEHMLGFAEKVRNKW